MGIGLSCFHRVFVVEFRRRSGRNWQRLEWWVNCAWVEHQVYVYILHFASYGRSTKTSFRYLKWPEHTVCC